MKYFAGITNLDDLKNAFRELCKIHHPDLGGDLRTMQEINAEYSRILATGNFDFGQSTAEIEEAIRDIIERATVLDGLVIELCGRWVWFTGATYKWKDQLKALGCLFAGKKKAWYWRPADEERKGGHKPMELDKIKEKYGAISFETKKAACLA
jgi:hypothetical protein